VTTGVREEPPRFRSHPRCAPRETESGSLMAVTAKYARNRALNAGGADALRAVRSKPMGGRDLRENEIGSKSPCPGRHPMVNRRFSQPVDIRALASGPA
jgi:hypothetical protein